MEYRRIQISAEQQNRNGAAEVGVLMIPVKPKKHVTGTAQQLPESAAIDIALYGLFSAVQH